jgi:hypothetical protein
LPPPPGPLQPAKSATDAAGDLFLSGTYIELGISAWGNFGTTQGQTPEGYAQAGSQGVGLTFNQAGFDVNGAIPTIDFFTPGTPYESFAAGYTIGGTNSFGSNYKDGSVQGITTTSLTNTSSGSGLSAVWVGVLNSNLQVTINYSFNATDLYFTTNVTLTNLSGSAMSDARYDREVDPDNTEFVSGSGGFSTINTIIAQEPGSGASEVTAVSATGDTYYLDTGSTATLLLYSTDPHSRVAEGLSFSGTLNPFTPLFTSASGVNGAAPAGSTTGLSDTAININYDGGPLAAGASTSFTYYTGLTSDISATLAAIAAAQAPVVTDTVAVNGYTVTGTADANATVIIIEGTTTVGTVMSDASGNWQFDGSTLSPGPHTLIASETNASNATGSAAAVTVTSPNSRFVLGDSKTVTTGSFFGSNYTGPVSYLNAQYGYTGSDNVVLSATVPNVFIQGGSGEDALQAFAGSNVLAAGSGSTWMVGASGADGGTDTFFISAQNGQANWDTILNFHVGDMLTLWGYNSNNGTTSLTDNMGATGYKGETLGVNFGGGSGSTALITFAGLASSSAHLEMSADSSGGVNYLSVVRTS